MGFMSPQLPPVDAGTFRTLSRSERLQLLTRHWVEHGFGTPYAVYFFYIVKCLLYVVLRSTVERGSRGCGRASVQVRRLHLARKAENA